MIKKATNLILIMVITFIGINFFCYEVHSADTVDNVMQGAKDFLKAGNETTIDEGELQNNSKFLYNLLLAFGIIVAIVIGMVLGLQFMTASVEEKAKVKESLVAYIAGCVVVFGAFGIWRLAVRVLSKW